MNPFATDPFRVLFRFGGLAALGYGTFLLCVDGAAHTGAFSLYSAVPAWLLAAILLTGGWLQFVGCCLYRRPWAVAGAVLSLLVFLTAEFSCLSQRPATTGIPAYLIIAGFYTLMVYGKFRDHALRL